MEKYLTHLFDQIAASVPDILIALVILIASLYLAGLLANLLERALERRQADAGLPHLLSQILRWTIITFGVVSALQRFFDVTAFLAGLGILGFTVGFALQDIMKNFAAGVILLLQKPFVVGDAVTAANYGGTVLTIDLRTTEMKTWDGRIVVLPNAAILDSPIENYTRSNRRRVDLPVGVGYASKPEQVRGIVMDVIQSVAGVVKDPVPSVIFQNFGGSSIDLTAYFWIDAKLTDPLTAKDEALTKVKAAFEQANVDIPYPIQTIHLHPEN